MVAAAAAAAAVLEPMARSRLTEAGGAADAEAMGEAGLPKLPLPLLLLREREEEVVGAGWAASKGASIRPSRAAGLAAAVEGVAPVAAARAAAVAPARGGKLRQGVHGYEPLCCSVLGAC